MGQVAGRLKNIVRPIKNYNVEERAFKAISKDKPTQAPVHDKMKQIMKDIKNDPELLTRGKMDPITMSNLSKVYITSEGNNREMGTGTRRQLPSSRKSHEDYEYGYEDPKVIPKGKASMRQILEILSNYDSKPLVHTAEKAALDYNLKVEDVNNLIKHFKPFQVHIPPKEQQARIRNPAKLLQKKIDQLKE